MVKIPRTFAEQRGAHGDHDDQQAIRDHSPCSERERLQRTVFVGDS
jgi:hypothetical protein